MIKLNSFESLQSLGAKSFVFYFANQNIKQKFTELWLAVLLCGWQTWTHKLTEGRR
jgi:hypothetical protein